MTYRRSPAVCLSYAHTAEDGSVLGYYVCRDADYEKEIEYLKKKVEAGADFVVRCLAPPCPALPG